MYHICTISDILRQGVNSLVRALDFYSGGPGSNPIWDVGFLLVTNFHIRKKAHLSSLRLRLAKNFVCLLFCKFSISDSQASHTSLEFAKSICIVFVAYTCSDSLLARTLNSPGNKVANIYYNSVLANISKLTVTLTVWRQVGISKHCLKL